MNRSSKSISWVQKLLAWYEENQRALPWREHPTPYTIWISEVMLQQTKVVTVIPYYKNFLTRFPSIKRLASASQQDVLKSWEGLGYYTRARNLHKAAKRISEINSGRLPSTVLELSNLPGIGDYTAAAIASIAFGKREPAVDVNVLRVITRFRGITANIMKLPVREGIKSYLAQCISLANPSDFNQALMELGAIVCRPRKPACNICPLNQKCAAHKAGITNKIPFKTRRKPIPERKAVVGLIYRKNKILVSRRPTNKMLGGLWEFPGGNCRIRESQRATLLRTIFEMSGLAIQTGHHLCAVKHSFSHFRLQLHVFDCGKIPGRIKRGAGSDVLCWMTLSELSQMPLSNVTLKVIKVISTI